jgi:lysozyme
MRAKLIAIGSASLTAIACGVLFFAANSPKTVNGSSSTVTISSSPSYPNFGIDLPGDYELHGIDVSRHQRHIDWEAVKKMNHNDVGISFAFIKASEGRTVVDEYFRDNWASAKENGIMRGAYHFYRPHLTADEQATLFFRQVPRLSKGDLPPVLDIEMRGSCPPARLKKNLKRWLVLVEKRYGMTPILYTNYGFYKHYLTGKEFKKYPLWVAHYRTPDINYKVSSWDFWQHSDRGRVNGIRGTVDFNVFNGDVEELRKLCKK